jgi:hypothetical protein
VVVRKLTPAPDEAVNLQTMLTFKQHTKFKKYEYSVHSVDGVTIGHLFQDEPGDQYLFKPNHPHFRMEWLEEIAGKLRELNKKERKPVLTFLSVSPNIYAVYAPNEKEIGFLYIEVDGYYVYQPNGGPAPSCWSAYGMREIADKLDELNREWDKEVKRLM